MNRNVLKNVFRMFFLSPTAAKMMYKLEPSRQEEAVSLATGLDSHLSGVTLKVICLSWLYTCSMFALHKHFLKKMYWHLPYDEAVAEFIKLFFFRFLFWLVHLVFGGNMNSTNLREKNWERAVGLYIWLFIRTKP